MKDSTRDSIREIARDSILLHSAMILGCMKLKKDFIESILSDNNSDPKDPKDDHPEENSDTKTEN